MSGGIVLGKGLVFKFGFGAFAFLIINGGVGEVVNLSVNLWFFWFDAQVVRLGAFLSMWGFCNFDQIRGF